MKLKQWIAGVTAFALVFMLVTFTAPPKAQALTTEVTIELVTTGSSGTGVNSFCDWVSMSSDGNKIVFSSAATDVIPGMTTNGYLNIYLLDVVSGTITFITAGDSGIGGNGFSDFNSITADGSKVAFLSRATNLISGMATSGRNIFLYDVATATTKLVTTGLSGTGGNNASNWLSISADGTKIVFISQATNLITGITTTNAYNVFLYDVVSETTTLITTGGSGIGSNNSTFSYGFTQISSDGYKIAFTSNATDLIPGITTSVFSNLFLYDVASETTTLITTGGSGLGGNNDSGVFSTTADMSKFVISSSATDLIAGMTTTSFPNVFLYDVASATTTLVTAGPSGNGGGNGGFYSFDSTFSISPDGARIVFSSVATNLIAGMATTYWANIFLYDVGSASTTLITTGGSGNGGNESSMFPTLSADGTKVAFWSQATDLIPGVTAGYISDIYLATLSFYADVTFDPANAGSTTTEKVLQGATVDKPTDPTRYGYAFSGWFTSAGVKWDFDDPVDDDMTLTAHWAEVFTITLELQNGEGPITIEAIEGQPITPPTDPVKEGFVFDGWFTSDGTRWDFGDPIFEGFTLVAHWAEVFTITLDLQNGEGPMTIEAVEGRPIAKPADPVKEGFIFDGWFTSDGTRWDFDDPIIEGMTLVAHWVANEEPFVPEEPEEPEIPQTGDILLLVSIAIMVLVGCAIGSVALLRRKRTNRL